MRCTRRGGHPSVPPERLLKSTLLMALYSVRSGRLFCEQLDYNLLFRWFLDMDLVEESFNHSTFSKNRERLLEHDIARKFLGGDRAAGAFGAAHERRPFTVDDTLIELPRGEAEQRDARIDDGSGVEAVPEEPQPRGQAQLPPQRADGGLEKGS